MKTASGATAILEWKGHTWISLLFRWILGVIFLAACFYKIKNPNLFALSVATYEILPLQLINLMAIILPWVELTAGLMLLTGFQVRSAALMVAGMMIMFLVALVIALSGGLDMSCGCFASTDTSDSINSLTILRDSILLLLALYVIVLDRHPFGIESWRIYLRRKEG